MDDQSSYEKPGDHRVVPLRKNRPVRAPSCKVRSSDVSSDWAWLVWPMCRSPTRHPMRLPLLPHLSNLPQSADIHNLPITPASSSGLVTDSASGGNGDGEVTLSANRSHTCSVKSMRGRSTNTRHLKRRDYSLVPKQIRVPMCVWLGD